MNLQSTAQLEKFGHGTERVHGEQMQPFASQSV